MSEVNSVIDTRTRDSESAELALRRLRKGRSATGRARANYSAEQVHFIREAFLLDDRGLPWILERLHPRCSPSALWRIAVGRAYAHVPFSPRLQAALDSESAARTESERRLREDHRQAPAPAADELLGGVDLLGAGEGEDGEDWG